MIKHIRFAPAALAAAALLTASASAMAMSPYQLPGTEYSVRDAHPVVTRVGDLSARQNINPAWTFSTDGRNRPIH